MDRNPYIDEDLAAIAEQARRFASERVAARAWAAWRPA